MIKMAKKKDPGIPVEKPAPSKAPDIEQPFDPEEPILPPEEDPDIIPDEDPFETPPYEVPPPAEGP
jgi:hypothetical protein